MDQHAPVRSQADARGARGVSLLNVRWGWGMEPTTVEDAVAEREPWGSLGFELSFRETGNGPGGELGRERGLSWPWATPLDGPWAEAKLLLGAMVLLVQFPQHSSPRLLSPQSSRPLGEQLFLLTFPS